MSSNALQRIQCQLRPKSDDSTPLLTAGWWFPNVNAADSAAILSWVASRGDAYCISGSKRESVNEAFDLVVLFAPDSLANGKANSATVPREITAVPLGTLDQSRRVWTTVDSIIDPELSEADWREVLPGSEANEDARHHLVWLPHRSPILLEPQDSIDVFDWISQPEQTASRWHAPPDAPALIDRIATLGLAEDISPTQILHQAAGDVGSEADKLGEVDPLNPDRRVKPSLMNKLISWVEKKSKSGDERKKQTPAKTPNRGRPHKSGMAAAIGSALYRQLSKNLDKQRDAQLKKLLKMTERDPDRALRFAIPLTGGQGFRGLSIPGAQLLERIPMFGAGRAGPGDVWQVSDSMNLQLRNRYIEMANREMAAGRHRRAAYIFSELLGDHHSAANALRQGHDYHHAAIYYRDRLHRKRDAAECFEKAGEYQEAERLRIELGDTIEIARMWSRAGREDLRQRWLEQAVEDLLDRGERLQAAELLDEEENDRDRARLLLEDAWPNDRSARDCMRRLFVWDTQEQKLAEATNRLKHVTDTGCDVTTDRAHQAVEVLLDAAKACESADVRTLAMEGARRVIIENVDHKDYWPIDRERLIRRLPETLGRDSLIAGDCARYLNRRSEQARESSSSSNTSGKQTQLRKTSQGWIGSGRWEQCISVGDEWLLFGRQDTLPSIGRVVTHRLGHQDAFSITRLLKTKKQRIESEVDTESVRLLCNPSTSGAKAFALAGRAVSESVFGKPSKLSIESPIPRRAPLRLDWSPNPMWDDYVAFAANENVVMGLRMEESILQMVRFLVRSNQFMLGQISPIDAFDTLEGHLVFATHGQRSIIANGCSFASFPEGLQKTYEVAGRIHSIAIPMNRSRHRFGLCHERGLDIAWASVKDIQLQPIYSHSPVQRACWVPGARIYALSEGRLLRFNVDQNKSRMTGEIAVFHDDGILGLLPCGHSVAILWRNGRFEVYR
ncbi:MAG: hypothetical protein AAF802_17855 [Planctomycetota bacterium]